MTRVGSQRHKKNLVCVSPDLTFKNSSLFQQSESMCSFKWISENWLLLPYLALTDRL
jgi:hypothetical protein